MEFNQNDVSLYQFNTEDLAEMLAQSLDPTPARRRDARRRDIAFDKEAMEALVREREHARVLAELAEKSEEYDPTALVFSNGLLMTQTGEIVSMSDFGITQTDIDEQLAKSNRDGDLEADECFITIPERGFLPPPKLERGVNIDIPADTNYVPVDLWATIPNQDATCYNTINEDLIPRD
jgi:hypothetical protein